MLRIAVITSSYPRYEGDSTAPFVKSICDHLEKIGNDIEVIAPYDPVVNSETEGHTNVHWFRYIWPKQMNIMGHGRSLGNDVRIKPFAYLLLPFFLIGAFLSLFRVTIKQKSDVIYAHWVIPNGFVAALVSTLRGIPYMISLHGSDIYITKTNPIFAAVAKWVFRRASGVTSCSPDLLQEAIKLGAQKNSRLLAWGADPEVFHPEKRNLKLRYEILDDHLKIMVVSIGRLVFKKGFDTLLQAMSQVLKKCPKVHLVVGGDGPLIDDLIIEADSLGISSQVTFIGHISWNQVPGYLATADIFVLPSKRDEHGNVDGLPTVLLEAMSSGTAVVASNIGGVGLVIEHNKNGILVPPNNADLLAEAIINLVMDENKRFHLGQAARQAVEDEYNWDNVSLSIAEMLEMANKHRLKK